MSTEGQIPDDREAAPNNGSATDDAPTRLDPELSVAPDTIDLSEPDLAPAEITPEVADAASLEAAAAEARAVAAQAEEASSLVGGPMPRNAPVARASRDGTAPAGAVVEDGPGTSPTPGESSDESAYQGDHDAPTGRPIAAGERSGDRPDEEERATRDEPRTRSSALPLLLVIGAVVVLVGLLIWLVASLVSGLGPADAAPQDHPAPVSVLVHA